MTFLDAARLILEQAKQPLHFDEIARRALEQKLISSSGNTPSATMGSRLYTVTKEEGSAFVRVQPGVFDLAKRSPTGIDVQVAEIYRATRQRLRDLLAKVPPKRFETLIMELLVKMGFDESTAEVTPYSGDGGIDVRGQYQAGGLAWINAAVQVKRWKNNVQAPNVTSLRGSLQVHQQGILITTSDFSSGAKTEASAPGKTRIGLVNGEQLIDLLIRHHVGVIDKPLTVTLVDEEWWREVLELDQVSDHQSVIAPHEPVAAPAITQAKQITKSTEHESSWTNKKPNRIRFLGKEYDVHSWKHALVTVAGAIAALQGDKFAPTALTLHGTKWKYVAEMPDGMFTPAQIPGTELWIETHFSAKATVQLIYQVLHAFNYPQDSFEVVSLAGIP